jgi:transposase
MTAPTRYFDLVREMKSPYNHRLRLVESAKQRGIKSTAQLFATTVPTVRKWLRRYQQRGPSGLAERSRARLHQSLKTPAALEAQLVELRKTLPTFDARRLIREFDLPISHAALERIWRHHGLMPKRRRKYQRKQDLAHIKARWAVFQQISADTKDLDDIPHYREQAQRLHLPIVQYTARDVRSGLLFWSFAQTRSAAASAIFASRIQQHLDRYGVSLRVTPHVAQNLARRGGSAIDGRTTQHASYLISQKKRKRIEECFGWLKTIALLRKVRHRGTLKVDWMFTFACAAYNLVRMRNLMAATVPAR